MSLNCSLSSESQILWSIALPGYLTDYLARVILDDLRVEQGVT